jgi:hypothetical protein
MARTPGFLVSLLLLALPLAAEFPLSKPVIEPAPFYRTRARIASNGDGFLVTWIDGQPNEGRVLAARLDRYGALMDRTPIRIAESGAISAAVASDGHDYLVAYAARDSNVFRPWTRLARVTVDGAVTHGARVERAYSPALASSNGSYLLVYVRQAPSLSIEAMEVNADATVAGSSSRVGGSDSALPPPAVAANEHGYFVAWNSGRRLEGAFVSERAVVESSRSFAAAAGTGPPAFGWSVASDGEDFLLVWQQNLGPNLAAFRTELRAAFVSADGAAHDETIQGEEHQALEPAVTWTGRDYIVTFTDLPGGQPPMHQGIFGTDAGDLRSFRVTSGGQVGRAITEVAARRGRESASAVASNGQTTVAAFEHFHGSSRVQIETRAIDTAGEVGQPVVVSNSVTWQGFLDGASGRGGTLFAWYEILGEEQRGNVLWQLVGDDGSVLYERGASVGALKPGTEQISPAISSDLIVWLEQTVDSHSAEVFVQPLFAKAGAPDPEARSLGPGRSDTGIAIAATPLQQLVVWVAPGNRILGVRLTPDGRPLDVQPIEIAAYPESSLNGVLDPKIATDGETFFVAWTVYVCPCIGLATPRIGSAVVSSSGIASPIQYVSRPGPVALNPRVVWNGSSFAVWYTESRWPEGDTMVRRFHPGGTPVDALAAPVLKGQIVLALAWSGSEYVAATRPSAESTALGIARIDRDFRVSQVNPVTNHLSLWSRPVLVASGKSQFLAYGRMDDKGVSRVMARRIDVPMSVRRRAASLR